MSTPHETTVRDELVTSRLGLIIEIVGSITHHLAADPSTVMDAIVDVGRLPEWNAAIESVVEDPGRLSPGSQWVVVMHPPRWPSWTSRSTVDEIDRSGGCFSYTTQTDDGNPSRGTWTWQVSRAPSGSEVTVSWRMSPKTAGRRSIIGRLRRTQLQREVRASLDALDTMLGD
jgi:uncharacterized protein YndB with AHSA1/START domain